MTTEEQISPFIKAQHELKAPKNQLNSFGNYSYRSAEDILEAVKPINLKYGIELTLSDDIVEIAGRVYVKATATADFEFKGKEKRVVVTAYAREADQKKGMDPAQITGSASSYARKYALNGLYLIDDTKDADTNAYQQQAVKKSTPQRSNSQAWGDMMTATARRLNRSEQEVLAQAKALAHEKYPDFGQKSSDERISIMIGVMSKME